MSALRRVGSERMLNSDSGFMALSIYAKAYICIGIYTNRQRTIGQMLIARTQALVQVVTFANWRTGGLMPYRPKPFQQRHKDGTVWGKGQVVGDVPVGYWEWFIC